MKVGTDGVLLGAWVRVSSSVGRILDIGTGTGVIALMLAQRTQERSGVRITALDIGEVAEARANADASPWGARVETVQCPVQRFEPAERYDLIVSNPPFFVDSLASPDADARGRAMRRNCPSTSCTTPWCGCSRPAGVSPSCCRRPKRGCFSRSAARCAWCAARRCVRRPGAACGGC